MRRNTPIHLARGIAEVGVRQCRGLRFSQIIPCSAANHGSLRNSYFILFPFRSSKVGLDPVRGPALARGLVASIPYSQFHTKCARQVNGAGNGENFKGALTEVEGICEVLTPQVQTPVIRLNAKSAVEKGICRDS